MSTLGTPRVSDRPIVVATVLFLVGQATLVLLAPLSRATTADSIYAGAVLLSPDSYGYLANGATWSGVFSETWNRWAFLAVIRIGEHLGSGPILLVAVQALLLTVAGAALFDLGRRHSGALAGLVAASAVLLNPMVSQWVRFVHTEAMFYALVILAVWAAERVIEDRGSALPLLSIAAFVATTRPNGVLVAAACLTALALRRLRTPLRGLGVVLVWLAAAGALVAGLNDATPRYGWDTAAYTVGGVVIEGADHASTSIPMPPPRAELAATRDLVGYAVEHPVAVGRLALTRIWTETVQVRRHYPDVVNLAVGLFMVGYLTVVVVGLSVLARSGLTQVVLLIAVPLALLIGATFAVAEGRFGWAYLIALAVHAGVGASRVLEAGSAALERVSHSGP